MLIGNGHVFLKSSGQFSSGTFPSGVRQQYNRSSAKRNMFTNAMFTQTVSHPAGYGTDAIIWPIEAGGLGTTIVSGVSQSAIGANGVNADASLTALGAFTNAVGSLIANAVATINSSGVVSNAQISAIQQLIATITSTEVITSATLSAIAQLTATMLDVSSLSVTQNQIVMIGKMDAVIQPTAQATIQDIANGVWGSFASAVNTPGTMGEKLNSLYARPKSTVLTDAGNSPTSFKTSLSQTMNGYWANSLVMFIDGNLDGQVRKITGYDGTTKILTVDTAYPATPNNGSSFVILSF